MKKISYIGLFALLFATVLLSCKEPEPEESCDGNDLADDYCDQLDIDLVATFCSDGTNNSYYTYKGVKYECEGTESSTCDTALALITTQMKLDQPDCFAKKSRNDYETVKTKINERAEKLLMEVRLKNL